MRFIEFVLTETLVFIAILWSIDLLIPREPIKPIVEKPLFSLRVMLEESYAFPVESYGPPWNPMTFEEFGDYWMTLSEEDKFYTSTEAWFLPDLTEVTV